MACLTDTCTHTHTHTPHHTTPHHTTPHHTTPHHTTPHHTHHTTHFSSFSAAICVEQKMFSEAEVLYRQLIHRNPENCSYLQGLERCLHLDSEASRLANYRDLARSYPRSRMIRKMPLTISSGNYNFTTVH